MRKRWFASTARGLAVAGLFMTLFPSCAPPEPCARSGQNLNETATAIQDALCGLGEDIKAIPVRVGGADVGTDFFSSQNLAPNTDLLLSVTNVPGSLAAASTAAALETPEGGTGDLTGIFPESPELPIELPDGTTVQVPIDVGVTWTINGGGHILQEDRDMAVLDGGLDQPNLHMGIVPPLVGMTDSTTVQGQARAAVRLTADTSAIPAAGADTVQVVANPPPLPLPLAALQIPDMIVLFQDKNLTGNMLLVVPADPAFRNLKPAIDALGKVKDAVPAGTLQGALAFVDFTSFVNGVGTVADALDNADIKPVIADDDDRSDINDLNDINLHSEPLITDLDWHINDIEAEDELSSLAYVGAPDDRIRLYNDEDQADGEGELDIVLNRFPLAFIGDLHSAAPQLGAYNLISGGFTGDADVIVMHEPAGHRREAGVCLFCHSITGFGDEFSSLRFER